MKGSEGEVYGVTGLLHPNHNARSEPDEVLECRVVFWLAVSAAADAAETPGLIESLLLSLRTEEPPVSQLAKNSRPLHLGLKSLQKLLAVFSITERYVCQVSIFSIFSKTNRAGRSARRTDYTTIEMVNCNDKRRQGNDIYVKSPASRRIPGICAFSSSVSERMGADTVSWSMIPRIFRLDLRPDDVEAFRPPAFASPITL